VILDLFNPFFSDLMRGVEDTAYEAGYSVIVCRSNGDPAREEAYIRVLEERGVTGMLIIPMGRVVLQPELVVRESTIGSS
jgi:LacI family transcriptional regulator